ncbi:Uma2 family endonuclease [Rubrivirga sp. S365]|uniref:Uma2 family endonuclease n=1 Tax=Rubrivirga litoralis TaxID=3075598 RepID=A0ABU3BM30_9BACT|nr:MULTISPECIES: Uma2 family endonuclease [unclassified Rubrivirga]MDT0630347.1 Uma2 family endonuclease [Rubrivirga sp. F394]MDT7855858.1 Uma2 family endonuclease [Rubrivirga sp. S365]
MPVAAPAPPQIETPQPHWVWTREQYDRIVEAGVLGPDDKVELLDGQIVPKMPQNRPHRVATTLVGQALRAVLGTDVFVQEEKPVALSDLSEPEPDVAVVFGSPRDYDPHPGPKAIALLVEVADSSLLRDRVRKAQVYAEAGIPEYWIVNLQDQILEVHRDPAGGAYGTKATHGRGGAVSPLGAPDATVAVTDLLP